MTDRKKLIELLKENCHFGQKCPGECTGCMADHLIANGVTVQKWISVKDRLPKPREDVLVCVFWHEKYQTRPGWYSDQDGLWYVDVSAYWRWGLQVTHWMPLPEPPKEGEA